MKRLNEVKPNSWLISNSTFYFATQLVEDKIPLNIYSVWDLCNLSEAILLAEKIIIMPGSRSNDAVTELKEKKIVETLDVKSDMNDIVLELKGAHPIKNEDVKLGLATLMQKIFPSVDKKEIMSAITDAPDVGGEIYHSPDWGGWATKHNINNDMALDSMRLGVTFGSDTDRKVLAEVYLRCFVYLRLAALRQLNYYPDAVRLPIVCYLNDFMKEKISKYILSLMQRSNYIRKKQILSLNKSIGSDIYQVDSPAAISMIIKQCKTKNDFIDRALELRKDKRVEGFRKWLRDAGEALLNHPNKFMKMTKQAQEAMDGSKIDWKLLGENSTLGISLNGNTTVNVPIGKFIGFSGERIGQFFKPSRKSLLFLQNVTRNLDQVAARKSDFDRLFGRSLSGEELKQMSKLCSYQRNYLEKDTSNI